jgi:hypothetical protein
LVDWDTLQIDDKLDDEVRLKFRSEEQVYALLGVKKQDDNEKQEREGGASFYSVLNDYHDKCATIPIFQHLPRGEEDV